MITMPDAQNYPSSDECVTQKFDRAVAEHGRGLYHMCYRILGNPADAEDALQDALMGAWRGFGRFREESALKTWLYRIARNAAMQVHRKNSAFQTALVPTNEPGELYCEKLGFGPPDAVYASSLKSAAIAAAMKKLDTKTGLVLLEWADHDYRKREVEVAEILGMPVGTVKSRVSRGRVKLRKKLITEAAALGVPIEEFGGLI
jgi:RNA polymerase sigma-70 factor (ECF subfamily)